MFIFNRDYPFENIPPIVVGRMRIDNILIQISTLNNTVGIDITPYGTLTYCVS